jgi:Holliday junction resolvase RusA-like endonuclease
VIAFDVVGTPAPKGSFRVVTRGRGGRPLPFPKVLKDSERTQSWHAEVATQAAHAMRGEGPFVNMPLSLEVTFRLVRPQGHYGKRGLLPSSPPAPSVKPDIDKLLRATLDPLEGIVYDGDSRIVEVTARKVYAAIGQAPGAWIAVSVWAP